MGKGKRRAFNDPAKQLEALQKAKEVRWHTAEDGSGGWTVREGEAFYEEAKPRKGYYFDESGEWDKEKLKKLLETTPLPSQYVWGGVDFAQEYDGTTKPKEEVKDPVQDWADKWAENEKAK